MAAGLGFKDFTTGEVLTANDVDGYLMQGVWVFASAAARTSAVPSPQEGNMSFLKDTNSTEYYSGSAWVAVAGASGGMTSLASGSLAAAAVGFDLTSIDQTYNSLILYVAALSANGAGLGSNNTITLNNDTGGNYSFTGTRDGSVVNINSGTGIDVMSNEQATGTFSIFAQFHNYANTTSKKLYTTLGKSHATVIPKSISGMWADNSAINRITLTLGAGAYDAGTYVLYGVR
jgi:hypothetical protein